MMKVGIIGSGTMGSGIGQVAAMAGCEVYLYDANTEAGSRALKSIGDSLAKFVSKGKISPEDSKAAFGRIYIVEELKVLSEADLVIEAIIENLEIKKSVFKSLEEVVSKDCTIASNTSSLSITSLASSLKYPERFIGIHFFNPPVLMRLVEVTSAVQTSPELREKVGKMIKMWGKTVVFAKDTPGFIVNKVARPFYSEAIRIYEEGLASVAQIDSVMTHHGFRMGPFTLMDYIGHDVNYKVTESVWKAFFYDGRYKPSFTQLRLMEAGYLGRKSGRGFYDYNQPLTEVGEVPSKLSDDIFMRIISMLVNEAADTVYQNICTEEDVENAMKLGVNYPKGLLEWGKEIGYQRIVDYLDELHNIYGEERYRVSRYLRNLIKI